MLQHLWKLSLKNQLHRSWGFASKTYARQSFGHELVTENWRKTVFQFFLPTLWEQILLLGNVSVLILSFWFSFVLASFCSFFSCLPGFLTSCLNDNSKHQFNNIVVPLLHSCKIISNLLFFCILFIPRNWESLQIVLIRNWNLKKMSTSVSYEQSLFLSIAKHKFVGNIMNCNFVDGLITFSHKVGWHWFHSKTKLLDWKSSKHTDNSFLHNWAQSSVKCDYKKEYNYLM